ncbi:ABC transporter ATP-binding protein [Telluria mixta]|uniref:ABC transporter ATP-binding protein n=1 Tax=Telluria mixta TaxID=34071 RepID=A0ABT2BSX4_9BURK|nr:ABC transporter ATP-binding protein [Telluria mixta]MCS0628218.1 ABC transporter ATP-binding protein [Telluria mixta]WEM93668.1 ABC transporter ATP-binding protein [Telluria mixta]
MTALLSIAGVSKRYGALKVTDDVTLSVDTGETLGILGPNGAGKTTLFNLISGDVRADRGTITFAGSDISAVPAYRRCRAGIGRSYQVPQPYGAMTVFENCLVAATFGAELSEHEAYPLCVDVLDKTGLLKKANELAGGLPLLDRKRLELARALSTRPQLLLLDEIAGGLTEHEAAVLVGEIKAIKAQGVTMIWIEHVVHALLAVADRLLVLNFGAVLAEGKPLDVLENPEVKRVYMGLEA